jgi:hypothetical protein
MNEKIDTGSWQYFELGELFDVNYGVNLELVNLEETTLTGKDAIRLV